MKKLIMIVIILAVSIPFKIMAFETSGTAAILMDQNSHRILYSKNIHTIRAVASISKIMTAVLAIESTKINQIVTIDEQIKKAYGSAIYIKVGEEIKLEDLVYGLMLRSGNDAAIAIAVAISSTPDEFVKTMNSKAKEIGMKNTTFNNPSGLDDKNGNLSTAYDMAILTSYAMKNHIYKRITSTKKHTVKTNMNTYTWQNKNKLLDSYQYTTGGKTGFTDVAKRTLVSTASKENLNLVVVTLNNGNDFLDHKSLYTEAFNTYSNYTIFDAGIIQINDEKKYDNHQLYIKNKITYPLTEIEKENIMLHFKLNTLNKIRNNQKIGVLEVKLGDKQIITEDIYASKLLDKKSIFEKIKDIFTNLW